MVVPLLAEKLRIQRFYLFLCRLVQNPLLLSMLFWGQKRSFYAVVRYIQSITSQPYLEVGWRFIKLRQVCLQALRRALGTLEGELTFFRGGEFTIYSYFLILSFSSQIQIYTSSSWQTMATKGDSPTSSPYLFLISLITLQTVHITPHIPILTANWSMAIAERREMMLSSPELLTELPRVIKTWSIMTMLVMQMALTVNISTIFLCSLVLILACSLMESTLTTQILAQTLEDWISASDSPLFSQTLILFQEDSRSFYYTFFSITSQRRKEMVKRQMLRATGQRMTWLMLRQATPQAPINRNYFSRYFLSRQKHAPGRVYFLRMERAVILLKSMVLSCYLDGSCFCFCFCRNLLRGLLAYLKANSARPMATRQNMPMMMFKGSTPYLIILTTIIISTEISR